MTDTRRTTAGGVICSVLASFVVSLSRTLSLAPPPIPKEKQKHKEPTPSLSHHSHKTKEYTHRPL